MKYGKLINGVIEYAPINLETETGVIFNYGLEVNAHQLLADGYKPVELLADRSGYSDCEGTFSFEFEEQSDKIVEVAKFNKYSDEVLAQKKRQDRDNKLDFTDKFMVSDFPISELEREEMKVYRQYLRDLPASKNFPNVKVLNFDEWKEFGNNNL